MKNHGLHARDGDIGHIDAFILDEPGWAIRYLAVDTRNWRPGRHALIAPAWIERMDWGKHEMAVQQKLEAMETAPPYEPAKVISRDGQVALYGHHRMKHQED